MIFITKLGDGGMIRLQFCDSAYNSASINTKTVKFYLELLAILSFEKKQFFMIFFMEGF